MEREVARSVLEMMFEYGGKLNDAMLTIRETSDPEEFAHFRRAIGNVLDVAFEQIIDPILAEHPDLRPAPLNSEEDDSDLGSS